MKILALLLVASWLGVSQEVGSTAMSAGTDIVWATADFVSTLPMR
jgi:hypothetical protein